MKTATDLVMSFEEALKHKANGGDQDTLYSWFGNPKHITEDGTPWLWVDTTEAADGDDYQHRIDINCKTPLCAAPVVKTEV